MQTCVWLQTYTCHSKCRGRRTMVRVSSLLPPCGIWEANSGYKAILQALLPAEPFYWPLNIIIVVCIHVHAIATCVCHCRMWKPEDCWCQSGLSFHHRILGLKSDLVDLHLKHSSTEPSHLLKSILVANLTRFKITMEMGTPMRTFKLRLIVEGSPTWNTDSMSHRLGFHSACAPPRFMTRCPILLLPWLRDKTNPSFLG